MFRSRKLSANEMVQEALDDANKELDERENEVEALKNKIAELEEEIKNTSTNRAPKTYPSPKVAKVSSLLKFIYAFRVLYRC